MHKKADVTFFDLVKNNVKKINLKKTLSVVLASACLFNVMPVMADEVIIGTPFDYNFDRDNSYNNYLEKHKDSPKGSDELIIDASSFKQKTTEVSVLSEYAGKNNVLAIPSEKSEITWEFDVKQAGLYNITLISCSSEDSRRDLEFDLYINDELPFNESLALVVPNIWHDIGEIKQDAAGNDVNPNQEIANIWHEDMLSDVQGLYEDEFVFYFKQGKNKITLSTYGEPSYLHSIKISVKEETKSYEQVMSEYSQKGYLATSGQSVKIQAETPVLKSSSMLVATYDRSSPATQSSDGTLNSPKSIKNNIISGSSWKSAGQWLQWEFEVEQSGFYNIGIRYRQDILEGLYVTRSLRIDGEIPFTEFNNLQFPYESDWNVKMFGEKDPYNVYLEAGKHTIAMEVELGDIKEIIRRIEGDIFDLNTLYRNITMITGPTPDTLRDYNFHLAIPNFYETLEQVADNFDSYIQIIENISGLKGRDTAAVTRFSNQLRDFIKNPSTIAGRLTQFRSNIASVSTWMQTIREQPLDLDYIIIQSSDVSVPKANVGFFKSFWFNLQVFFASFTNTRTVSADKEARTVRVWVNAGRDQLGVIKNLIADTFTPETGIEIILELVPGSLIEATLAGRGPDVALMVGESDPINFAMRGALVDLKQFSDFDEIAERFYPSAFVPISFRDAVYGLPVTQTYSMLFYRKDILTELGLGIPQTWKELYQMTPILQQNNMTIGVGLSLFGTLLFQNGGTYYDETNTKTAFDQDVAKEAFAEITQFFTKYDFPLVYDFLTRFRSGEMPLSIEPYATYNRIQAGAPELEGLWGMTLLPGVVQEDGTINRSQAGGAVVASIMFEGTKDKDAAWEFMKWWTSTEVQTEYGTQLEILMGPSARYTTANVEAMQKLAWSNEQLEILMEQWEDVLEIPQVPGSYYTAIGLQNAFRLTVYSRGNPYQNLAKWNDAINYEINRKYEEFFGFDYLTTFGVK